MSNQKPAARNQNKIFKAIILALVAIGFFVSLALTQAEAAPVANAGSDQVVLVNSVTETKLATLNGSRSTPALEITDYTWKENDTVIATGVNPQVTLSHGTHNITLTVTDTTGLTSSDTVLIRLNIAPVVNAGADQTIIFEYTADNAIAAITDSEATDSDSYPNTALNITWSVDRKPSQDAAVTFTDPKSPATQASFSRTGYYTLRLTANDGATSIYDTVIIRVMGDEIFNQPPVGQPRTIRVYKNVPRAISVNATDYDEDILTFNIDKPRLGRITITGTSDNNYGAYSTQLTYSPPKDFEGTDTFTFAVSDDAGATSDIVTITLNIKPAPQGAWLPPIGIPEPEFGIEETHMMYQDKLFDYDGDGTPEAPYKDAGNGSYTHYVDNTSPVATDTNNPFGTLEKPRLTLPSGSSLAPGSVVEIHGGAYINAGYQVRSSGTAAAPIFFRGVPGQRPIIERSIRVMGAYLIFENIDFNKNQRAEGAFEIRPDAATSGKVHHVALRGSEFHNFMLDPPSNYSMISATNAYLNNADIVYDVIIYDNYIHDNGRAVTVERDIHGLGVTANVERVWYVDNVSHNNAGDSIQVNYYQYEPVQYPRYIYIGRNEMHDDDENAVDLKGCRDVVVSQNRMYSYFGGSPGSDGTVVVIHYDPSGHAERVWLLNNEIYDALDKATSVTGGSDEIYFIGNVIHDIHNTTGTGTAFSSWSSEKLYLSNNTVYNVDNGVSYEGTSVTSLATIQNNIFGDLYTAGVGYHLRLEYSAYLNRAIVENNLFYQAGGNVRIYAGGLGVGSIESDPKFIATASNNFHLQADSPAIDKGIESTVFQTFYNLYGIDIKKDYDANLRPQGAGWDIGAYEYVPSGVLIPGDVNGDSVVNALDVQACVNHILGTQDWSARADVNKDSAINALDIQAIVNVILGV